MATEFNWFPAGPDGDYGLTWEQAGLTPPATLKEYWETYHPKTCKCSNNDVCEQCV